MHNVCSESMAILICRLIRKVRLVLARRIGRFSRKVWERLKLSDICNDDMSTFRCERNKFEGHREKILSMIWQLLHLPTSLIPRCQGVASRSATLGECCCSLSAGFSSLVSCEKYMCRGYRVKVDCSIFRSGMTIVLFWT
jgi:hypothetical protein